MFSNEDIDKMAEVLSEKSFIDLVGPRVFGVATEIKLVNCDNKSDRLLLLPKLSPIEVDCLKQLVKPTWDGYIISSHHRSLLVKQGLVARWNGWNFITRLGVIVLDTLGLMPRR